LRTTKLQAASPNEAIPTPSTPTQPLRFNSINLNDLMPTNLNPTSLTRTDPPKSSTLNVEAQCSPIAFRPTSPICVAPCKHSSSSPTSSLAWSRVRALAASRTDITRVSIRPLSTLNIISAARLSTLPHVLLAMDTRVSSVAISDHSFSERIYQHDNTNKVDKVMFVFCWGFEK
jgi:hypothetical protein